MKEFKTLYLCDPGKAGTCGKQECYMNNGPCFLTTNPDNAMEKDGKKIIAMSKNDLKAAFSQGTDLVKEIDIGTKLAISRFNANNV